MKTLIVGVSESGKTTIAKALARELVKSGKRVAVLDPQHDPDWSCNFKTEDPEKFDDFIRKNRSYHCFVDETSAVFDRTGEYDWWTTRIRHWGHSITFLGQRYIHIPLTVRINCTRLYVFSTARDDGAELAKEWNKPELKTVNLLPRYHFIVCDRFKLISKMRLLDPSGKVAIVKDGPTVVADESPATDDLQNQNPLQLQPTPTPT